MCNVESTRMYLINETLYELSLFKVTRKTQHTPSHAVIGK